MGSLEDRLRKLEERLVHQPSIDEYLDASNREQTRALHVLAERLDSRIFMRRHQVLCRLLHVGQDLRLPS